MLSIIAIEISYKKIKSDTPVEITLVGLASAATGAGAGGGCGSGQFG